MFYKIDAQEAILILIKADLRKRSLCYLFRDNRWMNNANEDALLSEILYWFAVPEGEAYKYMQDIYVEYVMQKLNCYNFEEFRVLIDNLAFELYMILNVSKKFNYIISLL